MSASTPGLPIYLPTRFPNEIKPGTVCNSIVSNVDFAPLWLDLAGLRKPSYMQGFSFRPLLGGGPEPPGWQQVAYHRYWQHNDVPHLARAHYGVRGRRHKLVYRYNLDYGLAGTRAGGEPPEWELFDCERDPLELFNCYAEPGYAGVVEEMTALLEDKMAEIGDIWEH